jgi:hypothetical protein
MAVAQCYFLNNVQIIFEGGPKDLQKNDSWTTGSIVFGNRKEAKALDVAYEWSLLQGKSPMALHL